MSQFVASLGEVHIEGIVEGLEQVDREYVALLESRRQEVIDALHQLENVERVDVCTEYEGTDTPGFRFYVKLYDPTFKEPACIQIPVSFHLMTEKNLDVPALVLENVKKAHEVMVQDRLERERGNWRNHPYRYDDKALL